MTTHTVSGEPSPRLATILGPEVVAMILVLIVAIIGLVVVNVPALSGFGQPAASPNAGAVAPTPSPSPTPSPTPTPTPTPTPGPTPTPTPDATTVEPATFPPSPSPSPSGGVGGIVATPPPSPTPTPVPTLAPWASAARTVLAADDRVVDERDELEAVVATDVDRADDIARGLRAINTSLTVAITTIRALERAGAPVVHTVPLRVAHEDALATSLETLSGSVTDLAAYRAGATEVIDALVPLESLLRRLAAAAGLPDPYPTGVSVGP